MTSRSYTLKSLIIPLAILCLAPFSGLPRTHALEESPYPPDIARIIERGKLLVALRIDSGPPLCFRDEEGNLAGVEVEMARQMAKNLNVEAEFDVSPETPQDAIDLVRARKVDLALADITETAGRAQSVVFGEPYLLSHGALLVRDEAIVNESGFIDKAVVFDSLNRRGARVGYQEGTFYRDVIRDLLPNAEIVPVKGSQAVSEQLVFDGKLEALIVEDLRGVQLFYEDPARTVHHSLFILSDMTERIAPVFHWRDLYLKNWYSAWRREWRNDPYSIAELVKTYYKSFNSGKVTGP